ncbi:glycosyltransferase protein [Klebsiella variicola]|uniref:glycosyltransferase family 4 protein n=1 Tax=Klebsiella variicola TaxID=244366 RepID=UPI0009BB2B23|nr:glycosyltransferase family 4 protein [Klebsiella variicola]SLP34806.1 glycosyltransferase protein [Klebsiella variicola]
MATILYVIVRSISFGSSIGGMEKAAKEHLIEMSQSGYKVVLVAPPSKVVGEIPHGVTFMGIEWPRWDISKYLMTMGYAYYKWCEKVGLALSDEINININNIIHFHGASVGALMFLKNEVKSKIISVVNPHGMEEFGSGSIFRFPNRFFTRLLLKQALNADAVISTDPSIVLEVQKNLKVSREKIAMIPNTIDLDKMNRLCPRGAPKISILDESINLVSIGRIEHNKGYDLLADALFLVKDRMPGKIIKWSHYGRGKKSALIKKKVGKYKLSYKNVIDASDAEVYSALRDSALFVQPSRYEGSSLTTLEAMSYGCLIVAMPVGGIPDKITDGVTGFLCKAVSAVSLADCIIAALSNDNEDIRRSAMRVADENYDIKNSTRKYKELYAKLIDL